MRASISLGRIAGIKVGINASVFLIIAILVAGLATGQLPAAFPGRTSKQDPETLMAASS